MNELKELKNWEIYRENMKAIQNMTGIKVETKVFYAVYQDNLNNGEYDTFINTFDKVSDAIIEADRLGNCRIFQYED